MYYVNDGVYGSFNCLLYDHAEVEPSLLEVRVLGVVLLILWKTTRLDVIPQNNLKPTRKNYCCLLSVPT